MAKYRAGSVARLTTPLRLWSQRGAFLLLLALAVGLIIVSRAENPVAERIRTRVVDAIAPLLEAAAQPVTTVSGWIDLVAALPNVHAENERLRTALEHLRQWEFAAHELEAENRSLRSLVNAAAEIPGQHIVARVIADPGGSFVHSLLLNAGRRNGVKPGLAVVNAEGLVGRITEVGDRSSRVLLVTDLNSRIPVRLAQTRDRAILAGDNSDEPRLIYLPTGTSVAPGERIVTSGHDGVLPAGLAVGVVSSVSQDGIRVRPLVNWGRLDQVRIVDYDPQGVIVPEFSNRRALR
jgi:rod shape-determining protein MreC